MKNRKRIYSLPDMLIAGAVLTGLFVLRGATMDNTKKKPLLENRVVATYNPQGSGSVDNATGQRYTITPETERNHGDNLDYQVKTGNLILERIYGGGNE